MDSKLILGLQICNFVVEVVDQMIICPVRPFSWLFAFFFFLYL